jgi:ADP-heptose:LPS heptosyltransferase
MKILALVPGGIGDQLLFFPALDDLRRNYPEAEIDVIVEPRSLGAYRICQSVTEVIKFDYKARNGLADFGNLLGLIRDREYDVVLSLGRRWAIGFLLWMSGIPQRIGYDANAGRGFFTNTVPLNQDQYAAAMYHDLVKGLEINSPCPPVVANIPKPDMLWAKTKQEELGITQGYIAIHGGSSRLAQQQGINKLYPVQQWQEIIQDIHQKQPNLPIVILAGPDDQAWVRQMLQSSADVKVVAPGNIGQLAAIIAGAKLMLCTDSAPMHISIAVGTYTIALFGPTPAQKLIPQNDRCVGIQSPTGSIADISPAQILEQIWRN